VLARVEVDEKVADAKTASGTAVRDLERRQIERHLGRHADEEADLRAASWANREAGEAELQSLGLTASGRARQEKHPGDDPHPGM